MSAKVPDLDEILKRSLDLQLNRVLSTYDDFMSQPGFKELPGFFREQLYAPEVRQKRVDMVEKLREKTRISAGSKVSANLDNLINLAKSSDELDRLVAAKIKEYLEKGADFNEATVEKALGEVGKAELRREQIKNMTEALDFFYALTQMSFVKLLLTPIKIACNVFGAGFLVETIEEGYRVASGIDDIEPFINAFKEREIAYWNRVIPGAEIEPLAN